MLKKTFLFFFILFSTISVSQNFIIQGNVSDSNNNPVAYANVTVTNLDNISIVTGTITDETGKFTINELKAENYILKISFLGYKPYITRVELNRDFNFESIILEEQDQELDGVTIVAKKPTVKRLVDRLVFNVENSTLSNNNVLDVLKHTPGVLVHDGSITIKNSTPTVYINDRRVHLSSDEVQQLLEGTSATNIKSIEVITNPPAKYEAEGGAVLNIVTSKNIIAGYNGSVYGNYKQGSEFPKYAFGTSHFFKTKELNTYLNYSISPKKEFIFNNDYINFIDGDNLVFSSWETDFERTKKSTNQNINANIDYAINAKNSIGFTTNIIVAPRKNTQTQTISETEVFGANKVLDSMFNTSNRLVEETFNIAFTLDYLHQFDKEGEKLNASFHHTNYDFSDFQDVNTNYFLPNTTNSFRDNKFQTFSSQKTKIFTAQIDYELPIQEFGLFEAGLKVSDISSDNILDQFIFENDEKIEDFDNSDVFIYDETNYAAYLSYSNDWGKWSFKSGFRTEYTNINGNSFSLNEINSNNYFKYFPSLHVSNKINDNNEIYFNYNKRIYRPRYSQLNPFKYFINDNTYESGDPNLKPQIDDVFTLGYVLFEDYTFEIYYRNESNPILLVVFQDNDNNFIKYVNTNINSSISYGFDFMTYKKIINNWNISVLSSLFYYDNEFNALESDNIIYTSKKWTTYMQFTNYLSLLKDKSLNLDLTFTHISPWAEGPSILSSRSSLDISLQKKLWNNRASLSIGVVDLFNNYNFTETSKYLNQDVIFNSNKENRLFVLAFNYKFGNYKLLNNKKEVDFIERNRINNKN